MILSLAFMISSTLVFAYVPLVECRRCKDGQFARDFVYQGRPATLIDYCDCGSMFSKRKEGKERISLLRALQAPKSLKMD